MTPTSWKTKNRGNLKELQLNASLYSLLQILSVSVFEKTQLSQAFAGSELFQNQTDFSNQLNLFDS